MRGIATGQRAVVLVVPELARLIRLATTNASSSEERSTSVSTTAVASAEGVTPNDVMAWSLVNAANAERVQFVQHCKYAARESVRRIVVRSMLPADGPPQLSHAPARLQFFKEPIVHGLETAVPQPLSLAAVLRREAAAADTDLAGKIGLGAELRVPNDDEIGESVDARVRAMAHKMVVANARELVSRQWARSFARAVRALEAAGAGKMQVDRLEQEMVNEQEVEVEEQAVQHSMLQFSFALNAETKAWPLAALFRPEGPAAGTIVSLASAEDCASQYAVTDKAAAAAPAIKASTGSAFVADNSDDDDEQPTFTFNLAASGPPPLNSSGGGPPPLTSVGPPPITSVAHAGADEAKDGSADAKPTAAVVVSSNNSDGVSERDDFLHPFYRASEAELPGSDAAPLALPPSVLYSRHFFDPRQLFDRATMPRLRNVHVIAEWHLLHANTAPSRVTATTKGVDKSKNESKSEEKDNACVDVDTEESEDLVRVFAMLARAHSNNANTANVANKSADCDSAPLSEVVASLRSAGLHTEAALLQARAAPGASSVTRASVAAVLSSVRASLSASHRTVAVPNASARGSESDNSAVCVSSRLVALTLSEAAGLRRAIHSGSLASLASAVANNNIGNNSGNDGALLGVSLAVRLLDDGSVLDSWSHNFNTSVAPAASATTAVVASSLADAAVGVWSRSEQGATAAHALRFLDNRFFFSVDETASLVRALAAAPLRARALHFAQALQCRLRARTSPVGTPLETVLSVRTPARLLLAHALDRLARAALGRWRGGALEAFAAFDSAGCGWLRKDDVARLLRALGLTAPIGKALTAALDRSDPLLLMVTPAVGSNVTVSVSAAVDPAAVEAGCLMRSADADRDGLVGCKEFLNWVQLDTENGGSNISN